MIRLVVLMVGAVTLGAAAWTSAEPEPAAPVPAPPPRWDPSAPVPWSPPPWFPTEGREALWVLPQLDGAPLHDWGPRVMAHAAIVADLDSGEILWARDPDTPRGIASVTKLFSSLALVSAEPDLEREICVGYEQWPSRPGARSRFNTGDCHQGWEYLGAALVASDNRGAYAFPAVAELEFDRFLGRMREVSRELGVQHAEFGDPAGLQDENRASARAVLKAVTAVAHHPTLAGVATAPTWVIEPERGNRRLQTTNRIMRAHSDEFDTLAAKTGYTDTARNCFATVVQSRRTGRTYGAVVLASPTGRTRWNDVLNMLRWAEEQ